MASIRSERRDRASRLSTVTYVNQQGELFDPVSDMRESQIPRASGSHGKGPTFHGFDVIGLPPGTSVGSRAQLIDRRELRSAAEQAMEIARRSCWSEVRVVERVRKGSR